MLNPKPPPPFVVEITVISAEGLNWKASSVFSLRPRLRPFITLSTAPPPSSHQYKTRVANHEGCCSSNPTWGDAFRIPLDPAFFPNRSFVYLSLFTQRLLFGPSQLGWCRIPASDIGQPPVGSVRRLSYRLRKRDGSRSCAIVNLAVKLEESQGAVVVVAGTVPSNSALPEEKPCRTVIGVPVAAFRRSK